MHSNYRGLILGQFENEEEHPIEKTADWEDEVNSLANFRVWEIELDLIVLTSYLTLKYH
jgi:hypothetical protein